MTPANGVRLLGTGSALPDRVMGNDEFAHLGTSPEWIFSRTGIRERRICGPGDTTASLGLQASRRALEAADLPASALDLIICATVTPDTLVPATACLIQDGLACHSVPAFDLNAACSGFLYGLAVAGQFLQSGACRHALVVGSDTISRIVDFNDRNTCILFGDGAGAVVATAAAPGEKGITFRLHADGSKHEMIRLNGVGNRPFHSTMAPPEPAPLDFLQMNGREVFKFAVQTIIKSIRETMHASRLTLDDIDLIIPHQVNQRILDSAFTELGITPDKAVLNLEHYGNTSSASVPIALDEAIRAGRARDGMTALLIAFGAGMTWASAIVPIRTVAQRARRPAA